VDKGGGIKLFLRSHTLRELWKYKKAEERYYAEMGYILLITIFNNSSIYLLDFFIENSRENFNVRSC